MVTDFGVAKALTDSTTAHDGARTSAGVAIGTPVYMAPEQAAADPSVDHRADLYALGLVAYEMLTGHPPFAGRPMQAVLAAHATEAPDDPGKRRPSIPSDLAALVMQLLEKRPADRPSSAADVVRALEALSSGHHTARAAAMHARPRARRRLLWGAAAIVLLAATAIALENLTGWRVSKGDAGTVEAPAPDAEASIAVMPFVNLSPGGANAHVSDGIAEELINTLTSIGRLRVAARSSSFQFDPRGTDPREVGRRLGVARIVEGSVQTEGERLRITARLVNTADGTNLWTDDYDRTVSDLMTVQQEIASSIASELGPLLGGTPAGLPTPPTTDVVAYDHYLQGRYLWRQRTDSSLHAALAHFQRAIERDSTFALAYVGLADTYNVLPSYSSMTIAETAPLARRAVTRALALDSTLAEAHTTFASLLQDTWNWREARDHFDHAIRLAPRYPTARLWYAELLVKMGRLPAAIREFETAIRLDPAMLPAHSDLGWALMSASRLEDAAAQFRRTIELAPDHMHAHEGLGATLLLLGDTAQAIATLERASELPTGVRALGRLANAYAVAGRNADAERVRNGLERAFAAGRAPAFALAQAYAGVDDERALELLARSVDAREIMAPYIPLEPPFAHLREHPRFREIVERIGLR